MGIFRNRPLALSICLFMVASLIGFKMNKDLKRILWIAFLVISILLFVIALCRKGCKKWHAILLLCSLFVSVSFFQSWFYFNQTVERYRERAGDMITVEGYVLERLPSSNLQGRFAVTLQEADGERISEKFLLECEYSSALQSGDCFRLKGVLRNPENTSFYNEENNLTSEGFVGIITCEAYEACTVLEQEQKTLVLYLTNIRNALSDRIQQTLDGEAGSLAAALLLGEKDRLSGDTVLSFRRSGISHLLALSGLHVSILILGIERLLRSLMLPKRFRIFFISLTALLYLGITGFALSTVRSIVMLFAVYLAYFAEEDYDAFTALCVALFLILFSTPYAITDISLWLSFAATAGIVIFVPAVDEWFERISENFFLPKWIFRFAKVFLVALAVGMFANSAILPLSAYFFGSTSMFSVLLTLLLSPILSVTLILCLLTLLFPWCFPIVFLTAKCLQLILYSANFVSELPNVLVLLNGSVTVILIVLLVVLLLVFSLVSMRKKGWLILIPAVSLLVLLTAYMDVLPQKAGSAVTYLRSNTNETLVIAEERNAIAIDFSNGRYDLAEQLIDTALIDSKCTELQELILTHYHSASSGMIASLSAQIKIRALRLPIPKSEKERSIAERLAQEAQLHEIRIIYGTEDIPLEHTQILLFEREDSETEIEIPVILCMEINGHRMLCMSGEPWNSGLSELTAAWATASEILLLGVHGATKLPNESFYLNLSRDKQIFFGTQELFSANTPQVLPIAFFTAVESKRFFLK